MSLNDMKEKIEFLELKVATLADRVVFLEVTLENILEAVAPKD